MTLGERTLFGKEPRYAGGLRELAEGTWAWLQPNGEWGESNAGLVAGRDEALLVDTLWDTALTARMLSAMGEVTDAPIRTVVNTHSDGDHVWGNQLVEGASIVSTAAAAGVIAEESPLTLERFRRTGRFLEAAGALAPRLPVRAIGGYFVGMVAPYDFRGVTVTPPTRVFSGELELDVGGRTIRLIEVGPAHTLGDAVVLVPDAGVVFAADVVFTGVTPVMWAGPLRNWLAALDLILEADADTIVPGHGPVCGRPAVEALRRYWVWLEAAGHARLRAGMSARKAAEDILLSDEFAAAEWAAWDCPERILVNLATLDRERRGVSGPIGVATRLRILAQTAALATRVSGRRPAA